MRPEAARAPSPYSLLRTSQIEFGASPQAGARLNWCRRYRWAFQNIFLFTVVFLVTIFSRSISEVRQGGWEEGKE